MRESNVMRLSPLWIKHEHGKMEIERENQFSFCRRRSTEGPSLPLHNNLPRFMAGKTLW